MVGAVTCYYCGSEIPSGRGAVRLVPSHSGESSSALDAADLRGSGGLLRRKLRLHARCFERMLRLVDDHRAWATQTGSYDERAALPRWRLDENAPAEVTVGRATVAEDEVREWEREREHRDRRQQRGTPVGMLQFLGVNSGAIGALYYTADTVTVEELVEKTQSELRSVPGIGPRSIAQIVAALRKMGLTLAGEPQDSSPRAREATQ